MQQCSLQAAACSRRTFVPFLPAIRIRRSVVRASSNSGGGGSGSSTGGTSTSSSRDKNADSPDPGLGLKAVWMGAEAFGNVIGAVKGNQQQSSAAALDSSGRRLSREAALAAIRQDFAVNYFVTGKGALAAYDKDCLFADPFASFTGTERFKRNVSNLGGLLSDIDLKLTSWEEGEGELRTKWRFSAILDLPWKPLLAAAGGTTFVFDEKSGLVVKHIEAWDVEPGRVVRQLLKPSAKVPATQAEVLMQAVHDGDLAGVWYAVSSKVTVAALPASGLLALLHLVRGEGLGWLEGAAYLAFVAGLTTEVVKVVKNVTGGESG